ncbi:hypothetical protein [Luteolibacter sp. Populi]|uniref:hypothetical protein n=1 Tax=Luteolibacter sp. Populi TaxID=3230487 RepID=UPI003466397C
MFRFEHREQRPISNRRFARRMLRSGVIAGGMILVALVIGMAGYKWIVGCKDWYDAFLNASMILGGMGPVETNFTSPAAKVFSGCYALFSGLVFVAFAGFLFAPVMHRILHRFHYEEDKDT